MLIMCIPVSAGLETATPFYPLANTPFNAQDFKDPNSDDILGLTLLHDDIANMTTILFVNDSLYIGLKGTPVIQVSSDAGETFSVWHNFCDEGEPVDGWISVMYYSDYWDRWFVVPYSAMVQPTYVYMSADDGETWTQVDRVWKDNQIWRTGLTGSTDGDLYYGTYGSSAGLPDEYYVKINRSTDGGTTWMVDASFIGYHIHAMGEGHDGNMYAGWGDPGAGPDTGGTVVRDSSTGIWSNSTNELIMDARPISIIKTPTTTIFGSDNLSSSNCVVYDGTNSFGPIARGPITYTYFSDLVYVDGVVYAAIHTYRDTAVPKVFGGGLYASYDDGASWYFIYKYQNSDNATSEIFARIVGEDDYPYLFIANAWEGAWGNKLWRITNIKTEGIVELANSPKTPPLVETTYSDSVFLANSNYSIALSRNGIRNPSVEVKAYSLTNFGANGDMSGALSSFWYYDGVTNQTYDYGHFTTGTRSLSINTTGGYWQWRQFPSTSDDTIIISFDAKKNSTSDYFKFKTLLSYNTGVVNAKQEKVPYYYLDDDWQTYTYIANGTSNTGIASAYFTLYGENGVDQRGNFDNFRIFAIPGLNRGNFMPVEDFTRDVAKDTRNVSVSVDGTTVDYGSGPFGHWETIGYINLTGDYYNHIPVSVSCDGLVFLNISGERISYGNDMITIVDDNDFELMSAAVGAYYRLYDVPDLYYGVQNRIVGGDVELRKDAAWATATYTGMSVIISTGILDVDFIVWNPGETHDGSVRVSWVATASSSAVTSTYTIRGLRSDVGYKVFLDGDEIARQRTGYSSLAFTSALDGDFEVKVWDPFTILDNTSALLFPIALVIGIGAILMAMVRRGRGRG